MTFLYEFSKFLSVCFSLRFSTVRFRIRAVVAKCGMPAYYGFYNGFWRFSSFTFFWKMAKNIEFRVEFRCRKRRKFSAEFPWKFHAKNMKIHENWHPKADLRKKRLRSEIFDGVWLLLGVRGGSKIAKSDQKEGSRRHAENNEKNEGRATSDRKLKRQCFYLNIWLVQLYLSIAIYLSIYLSIHQDSAVALIRVISKGALKDP